MQGENALKQAGVRMHVNCMLTPGVYLKLVPHSEE